MTRSKKLPEVLTELEQEALLKQANPRYPTGERNFVMMNFMLLTGVRLAEVINFRWKDVDLMTGKAMVREGKGSKDRTLWISDKGLEMLQNWRDRQRKDVEGNPEFIFTTLKGTPLKDRYIQNMVKRYAKKAEINKNVSPHTLRHTFATDLYRETKNIRLVQKALGHTDLSTTMIYTHIVDDELENALKSFRG